MAQSVQIEGGGGRHGRAQQQQHGRQEFEGDGRFAVPHQPHPDQPDDTAKC